MFHIMFVCTGNSCRSPMAAGAFNQLLKKRGIDDIIVTSSGTGAAVGFPATAYAIEAAKIWDADISGHKSQPLTEDLVERADLVLAMSPSHCHELLSMTGGDGSKIYLLKKFPEKGCVGEGVDDPIGGSLEMYNQTFLEIGEELGRILPDIIAMAEAKKKMETDDKKISPHSGD